MTKDEAQQLFRNVFCNVEGEEVLEILKEELGYNSRTSLGGNAIEPVEPML